MIVQWCAKGLCLPDDQAALKILSDRKGILCNWWRNAGTIAPDEIQRRLSVDGIDRHVNRFDEPAPPNGTPYSCETPFISLSAGVVERDAATRANVVTGARQTAMYFGSDFYHEPYAYIFVCWVILAPREAVKVEGVAEEVRNLNSYRSYSDFFSEGEVTAKISVPHNQIERCEKWDVHGPVGSSLQWTRTNPDFTPPTSLSNIREFL